MEKRILRELLAHGNLRPAELEEASEEASRALKASIADNRRAVIAHALAEAPEAVRRALDELEHDSLVSDRAEDALNEALGNAQLTEAERNAALAAIPARLFEDSESGLPVALNAAVRSGLAAMELGDLAETAGLRPEAVKALDERVSRVGAVSDDGISELVEERVIDEEEALRLGTLVSLFHLSGGEGKVAETLATSEFSGRQGPITDVRELLDVPVEELVGTLRGAGVEPGEGSSHESLAKGIHDRLAERFPTEAMLRLGERPTEAGLTEHLHAFAPLAEALPDALNRDTDTLDLSALSDVERAPAAEAQASLAKLVNRYPGLGIEDAVRRGTDAAAKAKAVVERLKLVDRVTAQNPDIELLALDFSPDSEGLRALKTEGLSDKDRSAVLGTLKAQQRIYAIANDPADTVQLLEAGYHSATVVARDDFATFARKSRLPADKARKVYDKASDTLAGVSIIVGSMIDVVKGEFGRMGVGNLFEDVSDALREIEGYADLFGPTETCNCRHCQSILSPAAYFVDLMYFVEQHVTTKVFTGTKADHALNLQIRRPDLWTLPLTCANTDTMLATLEVINEILESYLAKRAEPGIDLADRTAVRKRVYEQTLNSETRSFVTPFLLPHAQVEAYLEPFEETRSSLVAAVGLAEPRLSAAALGFTKAEYDLLVGANLGWPYLKSLYKLAFAPAASGVAEPVDVQDMIAFTGLSREELGALVETRTVTGDGALSVKITAGKRSAASVQNDVERLSGLTAEALDLMHRFTRLRRRLGWTTAELDLALKQRAPASPPVIDAAALQDLAAMKAIAVRFSLSIEESTALWAETPRTELVKDKRSLFDRRFNNRPYVLTEGVLPKDAQSLVHPAFRDGAPASVTDTMLQRLMLGLQQSEESLGELIRMLAPRLGANLSAANPDNRGFKLTAANLSLLYRHARLAKLLRRSIPDLGRQVALAGVASGAVESLADLQQVLAFEDWLRSSGYTLDDIAFATGGTPVLPEKYPDPAAVAAAIVQDVSDQGALNFADTVFAFVPGVTETMSRAIVAANATLFEPQAQEMLRLKSSTPAAPALTIPAGVTASLAELQGALARYHVSQILPPRLAARLKLDPDKAAALANLAGLDLGTAALADALQGGAQTELEDASALLARLAIAFKAAAFESPRIEFVAANLPLFAIADITALTIDDLRALIGYRALVAPMPAPVEPADAIVPEAVEDALAGFTAAQKFAAVPAARLGQALGVREPVATALAALAVLSNEAVSSLARLALLTGKVRDKGIGTDAIKLVVSDDPTELGAGAEALVSALRQRFPEDKDFEARLEPLDNRLHGVKRDALADYLIRNSAERFQTLDDLYAYFLIDVQFQGCARTSRVVAAISSVQTYIHRVLLNLEQDRRAATAANHVHVLPSLIPEDEWSWRKNYRVWEANRKVFLWPENYIEPELRDDKTPLFRALEEGLLQQDVTEQNVLDAYGAYLGGYEEVANLKIAGATHEISWEEDILHLFGCTSDDPPIYYYWTVTNYYWSRYLPERLMAFSAREKIDVAIPVRTVSPVVHLGRLHLFWNEISTASVNKVDDGASNFAGYKHKIITRFSSLRLDGTWTSPQSIAMAGSYIVAPGVVVHDALSFRDGPWNWGVPVHSPEVVQHSEARDDYTLTGFQWERVFPVRLGTTLLLNAAGLSSLAETDLFDRDQKELPTSLWSSLKASWDTPRRLLHIGRTGQTRALYMPSVGHFGWPMAISPLARQALAADIDSFEDFFAGWGSWTPMIATHVANLNLTPAKRGPVVAHLSTPFVTAQAVGNTLGAAGLILQSARDSAYVHRDGNGIRHMRLGTTMARDMSRILFTSGVNELLNIRTQKELREDRPLLRTPLQLIFGLGASPTPIDFNGPMGPYFREIFFQIPFLIADHLNGRGNYAAAQNWYHYVFDPTATLDPDIDLSTMSSGERTKALRDRVWRYIKFRNLTPPTFREILSDQAAIKAYKDDPFNPHAIARLRISAYQKSVVMKYVTNLIDWGDNLFQQFTMESVNEAIVLYVMALDILGRRAADVGECGEGLVSPKSYEKIRPTIDKGSEFLLEVESRYWIGPRVNRFVREAAVKEPGKFVKYVRPEAEVQLVEGLKAAKILAASTPVPPREDDRRDREATASRAASSIGMSAVSHSRRQATRELAMTIKDAPLVIAEMAQPSFAGLSESRVSRDHASLVAGVFRDEAAREANGALLEREPVSKATDWKKTRPVNWRDENNKLKPTFGNDSILIKDFGRAGRFGWSVVRQLGPVFCVPENKDLTALWDRVEDRLYKIRHCLDITGARRDLALFAPEIDPRLLVRARAEGLSLDDVLGGLSGNLPPYRFAYLIEKAKQYVASVQSFGGQLLSAIEKRDSEELSRLRNSQQADMLRLNTRLRQWELKIAEHALSQLERQKEAVEFRRDYYAGLQDTDLLPWERTQQVVRHAATTSYTVGAILSGTSGVLHLIPQLGSPFSMKYGGKELGDSGKAWGKMFGDTAKLLEVLGASAGLEASFERRREGWEHQEDLAKHELKQIAKQISAAEIRRDIAAKAIELHEKSIEDQNEIIELFNDKFSNLALYKWLSATLQRLYRQTFNSALAMARLAERAYRFERGDEVTSLLQGNYWDASKAGLLAGERLMADLLDLERRFTETNYRTNEIDQPFSLMQLDPAQLLQLRQTGECEFAIPEVAFDLFYPGHYRRMIRAARLTIACVTGPYTNVSATLTLKQSFVRKEPKLGAVNLVEVPLRHSSTVATSTAQNDAGVFDFSFRDERYMPFEGAGAVSIWTISLPKSFRPFDYQTINDCVISLSYSAALDGAFRGKVEDLNAGIEGTIANILANDPLPRAISLRQEHSSLFHRLLNSAPATAVAFEIDERALPIFLRGLAPNVSRALLLVRTGEGATAAGTKVKVNGQTVSGFTNSPEFPGYRSKNMAAALAAGLFGQHQISIEAAGDLAPAAPPPGDVAACDPGKLLDLIVYIEVTV